MKKSAGLVCLAIVFCCSIAFAQTEKGESGENEKGVSVEIASQWLSQYVSTGGVAFSTDPVEQSSLTASYRGFYMSLWHSTGISSDLLGNPGAEIDFYLGWSGNLSWLNVPILDEVEMDISLSYQDYSALFSRMKDDFMGLEMEIKRPWKLGERHVLAPFIGLEYYYPLSGESNQQGVYASMGLKHSWKLMESVTLEQSIRSTYDSGTYGMESGFIGAYTVSLQWKVTEQFRVDLGQFQYIVPISHFGDRGNEIVWGGGIRIVF
jgi:hypothetical protein